MNDEAGGKGAQEKKVDEEWKEAVEKEKEGVSRDDGTSAPEVSFSLFVTGLMMEALLALGEAENPATHKKEFHPEHAQFIIDTLAMLQAKTKNNLDEDESKMLESVLYELRVKYVTKAQTAGRDL